MVELLSNVVINKMRKVAKRYPMARRFVEIELLNNSVGRKIYRNVGPIIFGMVFVSEEKDTSQIIDAMVSYSLSKDQKLIDSVRSQIDEGSLRLLVAYSAKRGRIGQVLISKIQLTQSIPTGYVFSLKVSLGARGMGIGRQLLDAVEKQARNDRIARLGAIVDVTNMRSLDLFKAVGYQIISSDEIEKRLHREQVTIPEGKLLLEKLLSRNVE